MIPKAIKLHRKSKTLELVFEDDIFEIPLELLRVYSPSSEVRGGHGGKTPAPVGGKKHVGAEKLEAIGSYAIRLYFDDGHDTGLYSFEYLRQIAKTQETLWQQYQARIDSHGLSRLPVLASQFKAAP